MPRRNPPPTTTRELLVYNMGYVAALRCRRFTLTDSELVGLAARLADRHSELVGIFGMTRWNELFSRGYRDAKLGDDA